MKDWRSMGFEVTADQPAASHWAGERSAEAAVRPTMGPLYPAARIFSRALEPSSTGM